MSDAALRMKLTFKESATYPGFGWIDPITMPSGALVDESAASDIIEAFDALIEERDTLSAQLAEAHSLLDRIQEYAHDHSTGPSVPDALWEIKHLTATGGG